MDDLDTWVMRGEAARVAETVLISLLLEAYGTGDRRLSVRYSFKIAQPLLVTVVSLCVPPKSKMDQRYLKRTIDAGGRARLRSPEMLTSKIDLCTTKIPGNSQLFVFCTWTKKNKRVTVSGCLFRRSESRTFAAISVFNSK